jgi:hypothetical protein
MYSSCNACVVCTEAARERQQDEKQESLNELHTLSSPEFREDRRDAEYHIESYRKRSRTAPVVLALSRTGVALPILPCAFLSTAQMNDVSRMREGEEC